MLLRTKMVLKPYKDRAVRRLINFLSRLPISSKYIGPPKGVLISSKEYAATFNRDLRPLKHPIYTQFSASSPVHRQLPITHERMHWRFAQSCIHHSYETFAISIPNGRVVGGSGTVITESDRLLLDVSLEYEIGRDPNKANSHRILQRLKLPKFERIDGIVAVLATAGQSNYFHWMTEILPRLEILRKAAPVQLESIDGFVVDAKSAIAIQSLKVLGIPDNKIITAHPGLHIQASNLIVPSLPGETGNPPEWACNFLRESFLTNEDKEIKPTRRIYVSRSQANSRRVINEAEVTNLLLGFGFETVLLEKLSLAQQVSLFSSAEIVIAPHGAGLTNLIFCPANAKVLEIFSPNYVNVCFWIISNQVGLKHYYLLGDGERPEDDYDPHRAGEDIAVDLDSFKQMLKLMKI